MSGRGKRLVLIRDGSTLRGAIVYTQSGLDELAAGVADVPGMSFEGTVEVENVAALKARIAAAAPPADAAAVPDPPSGVSALPSPEPASRSRSRATRPHRVPARTSSPHTTPRSRKPATRPACTATASW